MSRQVISAMQKQHSSQQARHAGRAVRLFLLGGALAGALSALPARAGQPEPVVDPTMNATKAPQLGEVKTQVTDAMKEAVGMKPGVNGAPVAGAAPTAVISPTVLPTDPATRAAALRRKALKDTDFIDSDESNRDPFKPFLRLFVDKGAPHVRQVPAIFEKFGLEELALIAIVSGDAQPRAMFRDPAGLGQTVKRGDYVSKVGARITKILSDRVIVEKNEPTQSGEPRVIESAILVHPEEEAQK
ncbi:MAG TPA: pilus assembly protein PilP [Polyangia bacterium]